MRFGKIREALLKILKILDAVQVNFIYRSPWKMQVGILKPRQHQTAPQINDRRIGGGDCPYFFIATHRDNFVSVDR